VAQSLDALLKSVSRSFYLSLRILPGDLRPAMGLGYLLCRAADTVADTSLLPPGDRRRLLADIKSTFEVFPLAPARAEALAQRVSASLSGEASAERILLERYNEAVQALFALPKTDQALVQRVVVGVVNGMEMDLSLFGAGPEKGQVIALSDDGQMERYLEWIGGEPGRFWTDVCAAHRPALRPRLEALKDEGIRFGTGLQLVNILRDLPVDLKNGRCYIPRERLSAAGLRPEDLLDADNEDRFLPVYHALIDSAIERMQAGLSYVEAIPGHMFGMRAAVWWPLMIGLRTLGMLRESRDVLGADTPVKVERKEVYWLLLTSAATMPFNGLLRADFEDLAEAASSSI
jgi:farnesyl-diphosphate farnesyltransferase